MSETGKPVLLQLDPRALFIGKKVRTQVGDLTDLAASIRVHGLLQPVTVTPYTPDKDSPAYMSDETRKLSGMPAITHRVIYGQRRTLAALEAGVASIPCIVRDVAEPNELTAVQLVENLHREGLALGETAEAVRDLYDEVGTATLVAEMLGKPAPWVSKMLAVTSEATGKVARDMIAKDELQDLEVAYMLSLIEQRAGKEEATVIAEGLRTGQHNRATVRKYLSDLGDPSGASAKKTAVRVPLTDDAINTLIELIDYFKGAPKASVKASSDELALLRGYLDKFSQ
jgi:ParB/RepB/Spo0J family partition protein